MKIKCAKRHWQETYQIKKKNTEFWKEISVANNCKTPLPDNIEKANGPTEIAELWKNHFQEIFN